jgi:hypothetical protein
MGEARPGLGIDRRGFFGAVTSGLAVLAGRGSLEASTGEPTSSVPVASAERDRAGAYHHSYHQTLTIKIFMARKSSPHAVLSTDDALEVIRKLHNLTQGIATIAYLVGWQYEGHDSRYPAWFEVGQKIQSPRARDPRSSLLGLMKDARRYNTVVSTHINMCDAYENSPLWTKYRQKDLLIREADGSLRKGGVWDGEQSYLVCKAREWESGLARRRIDRFLDLLPIAEAGTVHIDVFQPRESPYHEISVAEDAGAMIEILKYWRSRGADVTTEWFHHEFAGLVPMAWHFNLEEQDRLRYPPSVVCGGGSAWNSRAGRGNPWMSRRPGAGCLYPEAWGQSMYAEPEILQDPQGLGSVLHEFCLKTLPWYLMNRHEIQEHRQTRGTYEVVFSGGLRSVVDKTTNRHVLKAEDRVMVDGTDVCVPALWLGKECIAYSHAGCSRRWELPPTWDGIGKADLFAIGTEGNRFLDTKTLEKNSIEVGLEPGSAVLLRPA